MKRFEIGSRVSEPTYGLGSVLAIEDAFIRIQFDDNTARKFLISLAKLDPSSEPAPPGRGRKRKTAGATTKKKATKKAAKKTAKAKPEE
jgi:hypothetical protein